MDHTVTAAPLIANYWQDFFMIPMNQSLGTVSPTHFTIVLDNGNFDADKIQQISYSLTFMYFNWTGNVKVSETMIDSNIAYFFYLFGVLGTVSDSVLSKTFGFNRDSFK